MTMQLTFTGETMADIYAAMRRELQRVEGNVAIAPPIQDGAGVDVHKDQTSATSTGAAPMCPAGHGQMVKRKGGTVQSGPRIGQTYPPFWSCPERCGETQEMS